jgi:SulP family sulfate permease
VIATTLVLMTPLFHYLPRAVLAAIIMTAVFGLIDVREVRHLWRVKREDLVLLAITFLATLGVGIEQGIATGVGVSLLWFVAKATRPHFARLGRLPNTREYRNVGRWPEAEQTDGVLAVRIDAQLYFGNVSFLKGTLRRLESETGGAIHSVVIDAASINNLDSSADTALHELCEDYGARGISLYLAGTKGPVLDVMRQSGLLQRLGEDRLWLTVADAVEAAVSRAARDGGSRRASESAGEAPLGQAPMPLRVSPSPT